MKLMHKMKLTIKMSYISNDNLLLKIVKFSNDYVSGCRWRDLLDVGGGGYVYLPTITAYDPKYRNGYQIYNNMSNHNYKNYPYNAFSVRSHRHTICITSISYFYSCRIKTTISDIYINLQEYFDLLM